ncbi:MAG: MBL fold metallo-hydrolase [Desulfomonilia bacterium]|jgi:glyoxylase-like metal-dependent hydrolase (beta-lactamase superfamily II)
MLGRDVGGSVYYWVAAYYVDGLLIDTGCSFTVRELVDYLENKRIDIVVNTHFHEDHIGANRFIQEKFGLDIYAHPDSIPLIARKAKLNPYQEVVWGYPEPSETKPIPRRISTRRYSFDVYETPGHSVGHVSLFEPDKGWCFSGDIFISESQKVLRADEDIYRIIDTLNMVRALGSGKLMLFTSIGAVFEDGRKSIGTYLDYLDDLRKSVRELSERGLGPEEIRDRIFGRESQLARLTNGHYSILNLIANLVDGLPAGHRPR